MSTASPQIARSDTPGTCDIPFIGWSNAAQEFRTEVSQFALSGSVRPLIIGDPGVGKKTMAKAWLALSPHDEERALTFVDLNRRSFLPPGRYIGVTTYRPSCARYVAVMGKGIQEQLPEGSGPVSRLLEAFWHYFDFAMYMPPLRAGREIDVLAFLEYWHQARAARAGLRYHNVSASLLHRMIFGDWPDNLDGIYIYLRMLGHADRIEHAGTIKPAGTLEIKTLREAPRQGTIAVTKSSEDVPGCEPDMSEDEDIPFQALRDIAVRMYLWSCCQEPIDAGTPGVTQAYSLEKVPLSQFLSGLTAQEFLQLDEEQFIRDHVLPNAPMSLSERGDRLMLLLHRINHKRIFGTSFKALKTGLSIDPGWVDARLRCAAEPACTASVCAAQLRGIAHVARSKVSQGLEPSQSVENFFSIEHGSFHIVFWTADGKTEEGRFSQDKSLGMAYYRHLIQHPERAFSPGELEREIGRKGATLDRHVEPSDGENWSTGPSCETVLDDQAKKEIAERLAAIERDLVIAERSGERARVAQLEEERKKLLADQKRTAQNPKERRLEEIRKQLKEIDHELAKARRDGDHFAIGELEQEHRSLIAQIKKIIVSSKDKYLDKSAKKARDRVKKAMEQARKGFILTQMQGLAHYLELAVRYKNGSWTYRPSKSSPSWQT